MKTIFLSLATLLSISFAAQAKPLRFTYDCRAYRFVGIAPNQTEENIVHPTAAKYTLVKSAFKKDGKWDASFAIEVTLKNGDVDSLALKPSGSGDDGYNDYRVENAQLIKQYWISSGSIYNDGSGGNFEGQDAQDGSVFFDCKK
jgi:hypothetical protein